MTLTGLLIILGIIWLLAYLEVSAKTWLIAIGASAITLTLGTETSLLLLLPLWLVTLVMVTFFAAPDLRVRLLSAPLLKQFRRVMPPMSQTEKEALEAGSVWWDAELFSGKPDWQQLLSVPKSALTEAEQAFLDGPTEQLCEMLDDWAINDQEHDLSADVWKFIREHGFFGMILPEQYGGLGFSALAHSEVVMKLASRSIAGAVTVMVPNSLGPGKLLLQYGTDEQRDYYLPRLARGEEIPCFALTGPDAGSDAGAMPDTGVVCHGEWQGEEVLGIRLNWDKRYITLGPVATLIGLAFKLYDPEHLVGDKENRGITIALIPRETPGVEIGARHVTLDIGFQNGPNRGHDVFVPMTQLIGGEEYIGQGWRMLVESLAEGRGISLPALSTGAGKTACRYTGAYAAIRRQFNMPIGRFEGIQKPLAQIAALTYQMDAARRLTLSALDMGEKPSVVSAIIKYHLTENYRQVINDAMDIQGGSGICLGPSNLIGRPYQSIPIAITVEGANILTRSMIIFGQGAVRCHPWVLKELQAVSEPDQDKALAKFDQALFGHIGYLVGNIARSFFLGLTRGHLSNSPVRNHTRRYFQKLNWMSAAFALCADVAMMTLGGTLKRKERLSARLGDVLSELYLTSAVLKYFEDSGRPEGDLPLVTWACENSFYRMQESLRLLLRNLPLKSLGWVIKQLIFPTGYPFTEPDDAMGQAASACLLKPSDTRDRLTQGIFITDDMNFRQGEFEQAFKQAAIVEPIEKTLREARRNGLVTSKRLMEQAREAIAEGLLAESDYDELEKMQQLRERVVMVDSFESYGEQHLLQQSSQPDRIHAVGTSGSDQ